jgi:hypothetical protein
MRVWALGKVFRASWKATGHETPLTSLLHYVSPASLREGTSLVNNQRERNLGNVAARSHMRPAIIC